MRISPPKLINKLLVGLLALFVFLLPLFFLSITSEYYEFNKQALLAGLLVIGYSLLCIRQLLNHKLKFQPEAGRPLAYVRTKFDLPIFLLLAVYTASTIFSVSPAASFLGRHGVFHGGLLSLVLYVGLFYLITQIVADKNPSTTDGYGAGADQRRFFLISHFSFLLSSFFLSLLAILQYFEIYLFPWEFTRQRFWTPVGSINTLLVYLFVSLPLVLAQLIRVKGFRKVSSCLVLILSLTALFLVSGFGGSLRGVLPERYRDFPKEISLNRPIAWLVTARVLANRPILGSGPATFFFDFTRFKPPEFNLLPFWNLRFNRAGNEAFEVLSTLGLAGIIAWIYLWTKIFKLGSTQIYTDKHTNKHRLILPLAVSLLVFLISTLFCPMTTTTAILFWVLLALFVTKAGLTEEVSTKDEALPASKILAFCFLLLISGFSYLYFGRYYLAEVKYGAALAAFRTNQGTEAYNNLWEAKKLNPHRDTYQVGFSAINLVIADTVSRQASSDSAFIQQLVTQSVASARKATELCPSNVNNWEHLAGVYQNLTNYATNAGELAIGSFQQAVSLDPLHPGLRESLGRFFLSQNLLDQAINTLAVAINLRPDYAQAHYDLAQALKAGGDYRSAQAALNRVLEIIPEDSPSRDRVKNELRIITPPVSGFAPTPPPLASPSGGLRAIPSEPPSP